MALRKLPGFRNVDMRRFPKLLPVLGPDYLTEEDYFNVGGPEALEFYKEYGKDSLISDLLNKYSFARFGLGDDESALSTFDRDAPRFKEGPIREYIPGVIDYDLPDVTGIPITSLQKLREELEMAVEGQGDAAPQISEDQTSREEKRLENFKAQARKDFIKFKDYLGEKVSDEERNLAYNYDIDYEDFTPIDDKKNVEYSPIIKRSTGGGVDPDYEEPEFGLFKSSDVLSDIKDQKESLEDRYKKDDQFGYNELQQSGYFDLVEDEIALSNAIQADQLQSQLRDEGLEGVTVDVDRDGMFSYGGPGLVGLQAGFGQIGQGVKDLGKLSFDFYTGLTSLTPQGIIRDILIGDSKLPGGALRKTLLDREQPFITSPFGKGITKSFTGDITASIDFQEAVKNLTTSEKEEVEKKVEEGKSIKQAVEEVLNKINLEGGLRVVDNPITGGALTIDTRDSAFPEEIEY